MGRARGAGRLFNLAAALGIVWGVRCSAARERMEGAGATWRPPSEARSPGRGATPAGRPRQGSAERGKQGGAHAPAAQLTPPPPPAPARSTRARGPVAATRARGARLRRRERLRRGGEERGRPPPG